MATDRTGLDRIVVVGASLAGLRAAETLRHRGHEGEIVMVGAEAHRPYDRPPLSKKLLSGEWDAERVALRRPDDMGLLGVRWCLGAPATGLDLTRRVVEMGDDELGFDGLVIATGAAPRMLAGVSTTDADAQPMTTALRTLDDSLALRRRLADGSSRVVVVGAGFIGLEVAATARTLGNDVVVVEGAPAPLVRGLGVEIGRAASAFHADHGVDIRCGVQVVGVGADGVEVRDGDGTTQVIPADVVVVGIGVVPATDWLEGSGIEVRDGVVCDEALAVRGVDGVDTTGIVAAGDVVRWPHRLYDEEVRIEHWSNAAEQGAAAAANLLAVARGEQPEPYDAVPFFWSDQYDRRIQCLGRTSADAEVRIVAGSVEERRFLALFGRDGRLHAAMGLNLPKLVMPYRKLLAERIGWDEALEHAAAQAIPS